MTLYFNSKVPSILEGYYRLTREPRRDPINGPLPDMGVFYSEDVRDHIRLLSNRENSQHYSFRTISTVRMSEMRSA